MLESLTQTNIGNLNLEEPATPWPLFDVDRDISDQDWDKVVNGLANYFRTNPRSWVIQNLAFLKLLSPRRYSLIASQEQAERTLIPDLVRNDDFYINRAAVKLLYPQVKPNVLYPDFAKDEDYKTTYDSSIVRSLLSITRNYADSDKDAWQTFLNLSFAGRILFPNDNLGITNSDWEKIKENIYHFYSKENVTLIPGYIFKAKVAFSEKAHELDQKIDFPTLKRRAYASLESDWKESFVACAIDLKALFSQELRVTDEGIEFIPKPNLAELTHEAPPLPETRKF